MTPAVNPIKVLQAVTRRMKFPIMKPLWIYLVIGVAGGGGGGEQNRSPLFEMPPMIKIKTTKLCVIFSFF